MHVIRCINLISTDSCLLAAGATSPRAQEERGAGLAGSETQGSLGRRLGFRVACRKPCMERDVATLLSDFPQETEWDI